MKKTSSFMIILVLGLSTAVQAKNITTPFQIPLRSVFVTFDVDSAAIGSIGFSTTLPDAVYGRNLSLSGDFELPVLVPGISNWRLDLRGALPLLPGEGWNMVTALTLFVQYAENRTFSGTGFGGLMELLPGYFTETWYCAATFSLQKTILTYLRHTADYRSIYPGVADGWFAASSGKLQAGVQSGITLFGAWELDLRFVATASESLQTLFIPVAFTLSTGYRF